MQTVFHLSPPPTDVRLLSKTGKTSRNQKILSKTERNLEKSKKAKNQRFWDNVLVSCKQSVGQIGFLFFFPFLEGSFGFGQNLSISRCFFDFGLFLLNSRCFFRFWTPSFDFSMFLTYKVSPAGSSQDKTICSKSFNTGQLCKEELGRFSNTKQQENQRCGQPDSTASGDSKPDRVLSFQPACTQPQPSELREEVFWNTRPASQGDRACTI